MRIVQSIKSERIGEQLWDLVRDFIFEDNGEYYRVRARYQSNGNSTPALATWYLAPGDVPEGFFPHDAVYQYHKLEHWVWSGQTVIEKTEDLVGNILMGEWVPVPVSRLLADLWFRKMHERVAGTRKSKAWVLWDSLRLGGWLAWFRKTCSGYCSKCPCNAGRWCPYRDIYSLESPDEDTDKPSLMARLTKLFPALLVLLFLPFAGGCGLLNYSPQARDLHLKAAALGCSIEWDSTMQAAKPPTGGLKEITPEQLADALVPQIRQAIITASQPPAKDTP